MASSGRILGTWSNLVDESIQGPSEEAKSNGSNFIRWGSRQGATGVSPDIDWGQVQRTGCSFPSVA